jgi:Xaa-Pro aminopeptidase
MAAIPVRRLFIAKLKQAAPQSEVKNLDPIVNNLRAVKSSREIAVIREATRIAGLGIMEAMRDTKPGMHEYELQADAEFVFKKNGALGASYFALIAGGQNTYYARYNRNTSVLKDGDLVQFDYAPDFKYYQSDVTRVFPANGVFAPRQREAYGIYLKLPGFDHVHSSSQNAGRCDPGRGCADGRDHDLLSVHRP